MSHIGRIRQRRIDEHASQRLPKRVPDDWLARFAVSLERATDIIESAADITEHLQDTKERADNVGKLSEVADRIRKTKTELEAGADALAAKLDAIDKAAPQAFAHGHSIVDQHKADLDAMASDLAHLQNLPLEQ